MDEEVVVYIYIYTHTHTHIYIYIYILLKNRNIMPFVTTCLDLDSIMLSILRQRKTNTIYSHIYVDSTKNKQTRRDQTCGFVVTRGSGKRRENYRKVSKRCAFQIQDK